LEIRGWKLEVGGQILEKIALAFNIPKLALRFPHPTNL